MYQNREDNLRNRQRFYCKINRNQLEIVAEASTNSMGVEGPHPCYRYIILSMLYIPWNIEFKILRKESGDEVFQFSFKFPTCGSDQRLADFNRFSNIGKWSCYFCLVLYLHGNMKTLF